MKKWHILDPYPPSFGSEFPEVPPAILQLLYNRNIRTMKEVDEFLYPDWTEDVHDPYLFRDMKKAVERLYASIERDQLIAIFADYDSDGVCAGAILYITLKALGAKLEVYLPHRETEGYGLNSEAVQYLSTQGAKIIITCDCGISNKKEIAEGSVLDIDTIITDHHQEPPDLPDRAYAIIHPKIVGETYPYKNLSGGGVAFKLAQALLRGTMGRARIGSGDVFEKWLLDLVAISTVADMVPLIGESRTLTKHGLIVLQKKRRLGLQKMFACAGITPEKIDTRTIGFQIAPRINAAGRMNHANVAFKLLIADNSDDATRLARELEENNIARQKLTAKIFTEACNQIVESGQQENAPLFAEGKDWPLSLAGLVAGKLAEKYNRPTLLISDKKGQPAGSGRSAAGFNLIAALQEFRDYFINYGGHPAAAGFTFKEYALLPEFKEKFLQYAKERLTEKDYVPTLQIDAKIALASVDWELYDLLSHFEPFGETNPAPRYLLHDLVVEKVEAVGAEGEHLRLQVRSNGVSKKIIGFCFGDPVRHDGTNWCQALKVGNSIDAVCEIGVNEWNGNRELQLKLIDIRVKT